MKLRHSSLLIPLALLTACSFSFSKKDSEPTLKSLEGNTVSIKPDQGIEQDRAKAMASYRAFLESSSDSALRVEALRRLADLELAASEDRMAAIPETGAAASAPSQAPATAAPAPVASRTPDTEASPPAAAAQAVGSTAPVDGAQRDAAAYRDAIILYQNLLRSHPDYAGNDGVLYQLAKAYEQSGQLEQSLSALDRLAASYPQSKYFDEVQFRRGEIYFVLKDYHRADQAYGAVIKRGQASPYYDKALYKRGWALFKQSRYEDALHSFLALLDLKLTDKETGKALGERTDLSRGEQELLDDTLRVVSLSFAYLEGAKSIPAMFNQVGPREYEYRVYQALGDLYLKQERIRDAASTYNAFVQRYPNHARAPMLQVAVIEAFKKGGFHELTLQAKREFVQRYGVNTQYWKLHGEAEHVQVAAYLKSNLVDLARYYHAQAQKTKKPDDYREAAHWYKTYIVSFPDDPQAPAMNFLLAESLFESKNYLAAAREYEKTAYDYAASDKGAEAGYAALLAYVEYEKSLKGEAKTQLHRQVIASSLRFADRYPNDPHTPTVMTKAADDLFQAGDFQQAASVAQRVVSLKPPADPRLRHTAWTVLAHTQFQQGAFELAEQSYQEVLRLTPANDPKRNALVERLAASVYKQGEQLRVAGDYRTAVAHFLRVGTVAPRSPIRATAEYDAAASLILLKDWKQAIRVLEGFRETYPDNPLSSDVTEKLAVAYLENKQPGHAAAEFGAIAKSNKGLQVRQEAAWRAAQLYEQAKSYDAAVAAYKQYIDMFPNPVEQAMEARNKLADISKQRGQTAKYRYWLEQIVEADQGNASGRTDRTRYLAATAAFTLTEPTYESFRRLELTIPLKKSLKAKKRAMQEVLKAYEKAAAYGVAEITTASTYRIGEVYSQFGRALMTSQRPRNLSQDELEQYNALLEEQAYPFEEKAIDIHETNAHRTAQGVYDKWVRESFVRLAKLLPVQYAKSEKAEVVTDDIR
jgi:TolA-binding protein